MHHTFKGIALGAAMAMVSFATAAVPSNYHPFGQVHAYNVFVEPSGVWITDTYSKNLTFSLEEAAAVRIDMHAIGETGKYSPTYLRDPVMNIYDGTHELVGSAALNPDFSQSRGCSPGSVSNGSRCDFQTGLTFKGELAAGNYTIEFTSINGGYNLGPEVRFGVSLDQPVYIAEYLPLMQNAGVPEPGTWLSMGLGLLALGGVRRHVKRAS